MTVADNYSPVIYTGNGVTTSFPFAFSIGDESELVVISRVIATDVDTVVSSANYTVVGTFPGAGSITYEPAGVPLAATHKLIIARNVDFSQEMDITAGGGFFPTVLENQLDNLERQVQQLKEELGRSPKLKLKTAVTDFVIPEPSDDLLLGWNSAGTALENKTAAGIAGEVLPASANTVLYRNAANTAFESKTNQELLDVLTYDFSGATADAPVIALPNIMQRRYIDVGSFSPLDDTQSARVGITAAMLAGEGREIVFSNPYGGTRTYKVPDRAGGRIFMPQKARIIFEPGVTLDFSGWGDPGASGDRYFYAAGTVGAEHALTANAAIDTASVTVSTTNSANYAAGDDIFVRSAAFFTDQEGALGTQGEWASVIAVNTGTGVLTLGAKLRATYNTADAAYITKVTPVQLTIENPNIIGAGRSSTNDNGDRGIQILTGKNCRVIGGNIRYADFQGIVMLNVLNGVVDGTRVEFQGKGATTGLQYGVAFVNMCENTYGRNCDINGGSEGLCLSSSGQPQGITRDVGFTNCRVRGSTRSGVCTHDNHENLSVIGCVFEDCEQGIEQRIKGGIFTGNRFYRMGAYSGTLSAALVFGAGGGKLIFANNYIEDALRGVNFDPSILRESGVQPGEIHITNNVMRNVTQYGVRIANTVGDTSANGLVRVTGNSIWGPTHGVEIEGKYYVEVMNNTFRFGAGGRMVWLHATDNGAGTNGAVDPVITGNMRDGTFLDPLLQHVIAGTEYVNNNGVIGSQLGVELYGSVVWDIPSLGGTFGGNFASTTVTVTGAAMGDMVSVGHSIYNAGVIFNGRVSAADTVTVHALNITTGAIDVVSGTLTVKVTKRA